MRVVCQDVLDKITVLHRFTLHSTVTTAKVLVVDSLSPAAEEGEDDDFGMSDDSGDVKERRFANCHSLIFAKVNGSL